MNNIFDVLIAIAASLIGLFFTLGAVKRFKELTHRETKRFDVHTGKYTDPQPHQQEVAH